MNILIIEDNHPDEVILKKRLELTHVACDVDVVKSLHEAEDLLTKNNYDLIFLDLYLSDALDFEDSIDFLKRHAKDKVVILTGTNSTSVVYNFIRNGAFDFLFKSELKTDHLKRLLVYARQVA